ncbi:MBL fold metallo-hydrolase [Streptomyces ziwulingensis]|uniref:MBL fold metallo-hydrolase n=1 Tax=Streptomyces ziwulingensis TaxID=1045501 RepID=A0ABP9CJY3_9ACTN
MNSNPSPHSERLRRPSDLRSLTLGETKVTFIPDGAVKFLPLGWLPASTEEAWAAHPEYLDESGQLTGSIGALLVEHGGRALLIDAGFGPRALAAEPGSPIGALYGGDLLDSLARAGRSPEDIEAVAITHLHGDHVGWLAQPLPSGGGSPAFPQAEYLLTEPEWAARHTMEAHGVDKDLIDAMTPKVRIVADGQEIFPGVRVQLVPGHTPGHTAYVITSGEQRMIAFGDAMHSPIQITHPEWSAAPDHDTAQSTDFRRRLVAELQEPGTIGFGVHFADVVFGHAHQDENGLTWRSAG